MQVALLGACAPVHNAIGQQLTGKAAFFLERGAALRIFLQSLDDLRPELAPHVFRITRAAAEGPEWEFLAHADLVIADYPQHYELLHFLPLLVGRKPRLVLDYHGVTPAAFWQGPQRELQERSARECGIVWCADFALAHSDFARDELHEATGYPRERILTAPYPTDTALFQPGRCDALRRRLQLGAAPLLLYVGRLAPSKRLPVLVEALTHLPEAHAAIVGDDRDIYGAEAQRCRQLAERLGVAARLHFLGQVGDAVLADIYRGADALVIPSRHEGYCLPVIEAMACGLPVIAARAAALPETVGDAGLTFAPDDPADLARQVRRALAPGVDACARNPEPDAPTRGSLADASGLGRRVAVVAFRFGAGIVGGAERSLRTIADALRGAGCAVEVFTTCTQRESDWSNDLSAGTTHEDGLTVHRFPIDAHDRAGHHDAIRRITEAGGDVDPAVERAYLEHSIHSQALMDSLRRRDDFDAIIVGPYLFGLTHDVARAFPERALLLPCFHDEPLARLTAWREAYPCVSGILYHTPEEKTLAESALGLNHPRATVIGTCLPPSRGMSAANPAGSTVEAPYLIYCGRYSRQKNLPLLLDFAARYERAHPGRFRFAFMGHGETPIARAGWARDLGRLSEEAKRAALAGAVALVQLSTQESLSLVALEAWREGTPVIAHEACAPLRGLLERSGGGAAVADYDSFAGALDDLWTRPEDWRDRGRRGRDSVQRHYEDEGGFRECLTRALDELKVPLGACMRGRGLARAAQRSIPAWRGAFAALIENILDHEPRPPRWQLEIVPRTPHVQVARGTRTALVPVRLVNHGTLPALADGPAQITLVAGIGGAEEHHESRSTLAATMVPGRSQTVMASVRAPHEPGEYEVSLSIHSPAWPEVNCEPARLTLSVGGHGAGTAGGAAALLDAAQTALAEAHRLQRLPDDYLDVTEGWLARGKRWLKRKLLGNFKKAYVDVLSRQQTRVNEQLVSAVEELAQCCAALDHAARQMQARLDMLEDSSPGACRAGEPPAPRDRETCTEPHPAGDRA